MYFKFNDFELIKQELKTGIYHHGIESMQAFTINNLVLNVYIIAKEKTIYKFNGVNPAISGILQTPNSIRNIRTRFNKLETSI